MMRPLGNARSGHRADAGWKFYQHPGGEWSWLVLGAIPRNSGGRFSGIVEAMADAVTFGFVPGISRVLEITLCQRLLLR
jgi:hypothetical protein